MPTPKYVSKGHLKVLATVRGDDRIHEGELPNPARRPQLSTLKPGSQRIESTLGGLRFSRR
jgi:hypothetical protein